MYSTEHSDERRPLRPDTIRPAASRLGLLKRGALHPKDRKEERLEDRLMRLGKERYEDMKTGSAGCGGPQRAYI
ncbi:MAG: hypothetical protein GY807_10070 [Gammaproteobacteria bacterium]|nr:hypothetical protein [Gammaproteobacteria bacterium]